MSDETVVGAAFDGEDYEVPAKPVARKPAAGTPVSRRTHNASGRRINPAFLLNERDPAEEALSGVVSDFGEASKPSVGKPVGEAVRSRAASKPGAAAQGSSAPVKAASVSGEGAERGKPSSASGEGKATESVQAAPRPVGDMTAPRAKASPHAAALLDGLRDDTDDVEHKLPKRQVNPLFADPSGRKVSTSGDTTRSLPKRPATSSESDVEAPKRGRPRGSYRVKADAEVEVEDWTEDESTDTHRGLNATVDNGFKKPEWARGYSLTDRDFILMRFMARYRYAYIHQLARLVDTSPENVSQRLRVLEKRGFIRKEPITGRKYLWLTRKAGNLIADIQFGEIKKGSLSYVTVAHTAGIANLGVELERVEGGKDILGEAASDPAWPYRNRFRLGIWGAEGEKTLGEQTITEREIRQAQARWRGGRTTQEMRDLVDLAVSDPTAPELLPGNEGLFVVYGQAGKSGEHIPDLVVVRERDEDGKPQHVAIELEMTPKNANEWKRILRWYRDNGGMFKKVYYFTHRREIANALKRVDAEVGLGERLVIRKYNPQNGNAPFWG